jgi:hypothetical protein
MYIDAVSGRLYAHPAAISIIGELEGKLAAAESEVARLRAGLKRVGSTDPLTELGYGENWREENEARIDFARQLLESPAEKGRAKP